MASQLILLGMSTTFALDGLVVASSSMFIYLFFVVFEYIEPAETTGMMWCLAWHI